MKNKMIDEVRPYQLFSPAEKTEDNNLDRKLDYFSLGNTFSNNTAKISYTDRLNNFVQRFSQELTVNSKQKEELLTYKKRLSYEVQGSLSSRFTKKFDVKTEEKIKESDDEEDDTVN